MKSETHSKAVETIELLVEGETDLIAVMSTISCELYSAFDLYNWVGFYRRIDERTLKVGPYQGSHGCLTIDIDRGICGQCVRDAEIQLVNDVSEVACHIACSSQTKSEIVLPITDSHGDVRAVLDIDATELDVFDEVDVTSLKRICQLVSDRYG
jgi:L-methionine (R)-S-oxide reductase